MSDANFADDWINDAAIPPHFPPAESFFDSDLLCEETSLAIPDLPLTLPSSPLLSMPTSLSPPASPPPRQRPLNIQLEVPPSCVQPINRPKGNPFSDDKCPLRKRVKVTLRSNGPGRRVRIGTPRKRRRLQTTLYVQNTSECTRLAIRIPGPAQRDSNSSNSNSVNSLLFTRRPLNVKPKNMTDPLFRRLQAVASSPPPVADTRPDALPDITSALEGIAVTVHRFRQMNEGAVVRPVPERKVRIQMGRKKKGKKRTLLRFDDFKVAPLEPEDDKKPRQSGLFMYINSPFP
ncbi:hypothetical protein FGB62_23g127 [Gracilaria domingensis]|nr:hypothetical protein FGB62_23g127 [Gracilaria domingensis]